MILKTRAIVLRMIKFGDTKFVVDMLTEELGRVSFIVPAPRSPKSKMKRQFFQPLSMLDVALEYKPKAALQRLRDVAVAVPFVDIPFSAYKMAIAMFLAEFLYYSTRNEQENKKLFLFLANSIEWLDGATGNFSNFHVVFMIRLSLFLGFFPNVEEYADGEYFDLEEGAFVSYAPLHSHYLDQVDSLRMRNLMRLRYETMAVYAMSHQERYRCVEVILEYFRLHIPNFPEMKTLPVLKELFA